MWTELTPDMLQAEYWTPQPEVAASRDVMQGKLAQCGAVRDIAQNLDGDQVSAPQFSFSRAYWGNGHPLSQEDKLGIATLCEVLPIAHEFGFSLSWASIRAWPSDVEVFADPLGRIVELGQLSTLHTFEPVRIAGQSRDGAWYLIRSGTYDGWVRRSEIGWCDRTTFERFAEYPRNLVVVGRGVSAEPEETNFPHPQSLEFGAWIPLDDCAKEPFGWQYRVTLPYTLSDGQCQFRTARVPIQSAVSDGYLPVTRHSLVRSALNLLGDRYGWGGRMKRRDCSAFVMDVYRTLGLQIPRDAGPQEECFGGTSASRCIGLAEAMPGDLLFMPGHVMLSLGRQQGRDFAIHAFVGFAQTPESPTILCNQVMITPLDIYMREGGKRYADGVTSVGGVL